MTAAQRPPARPTAPLSAVQLTWNAFRRVALDPGVSEQSDAYRDAERAYDEAIRDRGRVLEGGR